MKSLIGTTLLAIALFLCASLASQTVPDSEVVHPYQRVAVPNLARITALNSGSSAVAKAALAIALSGSKITCDSSQLESALEAAAASLRMLTSKISGAVCHANDSTVRITATFVPNGAIQGDSIIASVIAGKPLLIQWHGTLYVLYGVVYDEHLRYSGSRTNVIRQLLLIDPRYSDKRHFVAFDRDRNDFADVEGMASVGVTF